MKAKVLSIFSLLLCAAFLSSPLEAAPLSKKLYGADSKEVDLRIEDSFFINLEELAEKSSQSLTYEELSVADQAVVSEAAKLQVLHLYGVFSYHEAPVNFAYYSGAILESQDPQVLEVEAVGNRWKISYIYKDRALFFEPLFETLTNKNELRFFMPNEPKEIYQQTLREVGQASKKRKKKLANPCTDPHDQSEAGFWYYWSPSRKDCQQLIKGHIHQVVATIVPRKNTRKTYPEYSQLFSPPDRELNIRILYGQDLKFGAPQDIGRKTFESEFRIFQSWRARSGKPRFELEKDEPFYKRLRAEIAGLPVLLEQFYVNTEVEAFDLLAAETLQTVDVMVFAGHSYEGYYFDLERLFESPERALPKDQYQIFYFDACTTYAYYGKNYFNAKISDQDLLGSKNLDLLVNGIGAPFLVGDSSEKERSSNTTVFIRSLLGLSQNGKSLPKLLSWQSILKNISRNSGVDFTSLTVVKGDEDNPKSYDSRWARFR